eukprot:451560_1
MGINNSHTSSTNSGSIDLLVYGFIASIENNNQLFMMIPFEIKRLIIQYFHGGNTFDLYNEDVFQSSATGLVIRGTSKNHHDKDAGYMILAKNVNRDDGLHTGVHCWSVINHGGCVCIGIISDDGYLNYSYNNEIVNRCISTSKYNCWIQDQHHDCPSDLYYRGIWAIDETRHVRLDCNNNTITFFKESREVKSKTIQTDHSYYFAISMSPNQGTVAEIVCTSKF